MACNAYKCTTAPKITRKTPAKTRKRPQNQESGQSGPRIWWLNDDQNEKK